MLIYTNENNYGVYLKEDGDDLWITVTNGYCKSYDCIVGCAADGLDTAAYIETAYTEFYPAQYISENMNADDDRFRIMCLARDAYEIDRALELALDARNGSTLTAPPPVACSR